MSTENVIVFITGASRGFGAALAEEYSRKAHAASMACTIVCFARSAGSLDSSAARILAAHPHAHVHKVGLDFGELESIEPTWRATIDECAPAIARATAAVLVNNAGTLGPMQTIESLADLAELRRAIDTNVTAAIWLTSLFQKLVAANPNIKRADIVNVSSLAAVQPFATWGVYCAAKAARNMIHNAIATEEAARADTAAARPCTVRTLNYAPGPLDTDMQAQIRAGTGVHAPTREAFIKLHEDGKLVDPSASARACVNLLFGSSFVSGSHVDYFDIAA